MTRKQRRFIRKIFRVNAADNLLVKIIGKPPLEFLSEVKCPECGEGWYDCGHLNHLTMDQLAEKGFAKYVEQI